MRAETCVDGAYRPDRLRRVAATLIAGALIAVGCTGNGSDSDTTGTAPVFVGNTAGSSPAVGDAATRVEIVSPASCETAGCVAEGIDTSSGGYRTDSTDLLFPPGLFGVEMQRSYFSDIDRVGWFGPGWATIYETVLTNSDGIITIDAPAGLSPRWTPEAPVGWDIAGALEVAPFGAGSHSLEWPTGETWQFDPEGQLVRMTSPYGQEIAIERTLDSVSIASSQGVGLTLEFENGLVQSVATDDARKVDYTYTDNRLTAVAAPGLSVGYRHNNDGLIVEQALPSGTTTVEYEDGKVVEQRAASGDRFQLAYAETGTSVESLSASSTYEHDDQGRLIRVSRSDDQEVLTQAFDSQGRLTERIIKALPSGDVASSIERNYSSDGRVESITTDGLTTSYEYDDQARVVAVSGGIDTEFEYADDTPLPSAVTTPEGGRSAIETEQGFTVAITDATGATSVTRRDAIGNPVAVGFGPDSLWAYEFDPEGNITSSTSATGRSWVATWAPRSTLLSEEDPIGRISSYEHDDAARVVREILPEGTTTYRYTSLGRLLEMTLPDGAATRYEYAADGRLATMVRPGDRTWRVSYDSLDDGSVTETTVAPDGSTVEQTVDTAGRTIARRSIEPDGSLTESFTASYEYGRPIETVVRRGLSTSTSTTVYDDEGRIVEEQTLLDGTITAQSTSEFEDNRVVRTGTFTDSATYAYDPAGRLVAVARNDEQWSATYRDGRVSLVEHGGETTKVSYDPDGRAVSFIETDGPEITWTYDDVDRPVRRSVADVSATFAWNDADQLARYTSTTGAVWAWSYDEGGRLLEAIEPGEVRTEYEYDNGDIVRIRSDGPGSDRDDEFTWSATGLLASADTDLGEVAYTYDATGRVTSLESSAGDETWKLDAAGNIIEVAAGDDIYTVGYAAEGGIDSIDGPDDKSLSVRRVDGAISSINVDDDLVLGLDVDSEGRLASVDWGNDTVVDVSWTGDESFTVGTRGKEDAFEYVVDNGQLTAFGADGTDFSATSGADGLLDEIRLSGEISGTVQFDQLGRPATLRASDRVSSITYDEQSRVSSMVATESGEDPDRTTVGYEAGEQQIDGDDDFVKALFDESGGPRQSLPRDLPNPLSSVVDEAVRNAASFAGNVEPLVDVQPDPFAQIAASVEDATPAQISAFGVRDRDQMGRQLLVAEVSRLSPVVSVNGAESLVIPIIDPESGEAAEYNPFVDAASSGLVLGVLARQGGGGGSVFERAVSTLGDIVGGAVSVVGDVARFVVTNPLARSVFVTAAGVAGALTCASPGVLVCAAAVAVLFGDAVLAVSSAVPAAWSACRSLDAASCSFEAARVGLAASQIWFAGRVVSGLGKIAAANRAVAETAGSARSIASGRLGTTRSELRAFTRGERVIGREVRVCVETVCARADLAVKRFLGQTKLVEVKNGAAARYTPNQLSVYPQLANGPVSFPRGLIGRGGPQTLSVGVPRTEHWGTANPLSLF